MNFINFLSGLWCGTLKITSSKNVKNVIFRPTCSYRVLTLCKNNCLPICLNLPILDYFGTWDMNSFSLYPRLALNPSFSCLSLLTNRIFSMCHYTWPDWTFRLLHLRECCQVQGTGYWIKVPRGGVHPLWGSIFVSFKILGYDPSCLEESQDMSTGMATYNGHLEILEPESSQFSLTWPISKWDLRALREPSPAYSCFLNKVLLGNNQAVHLYIIHGFYYPVIAEMNGHNGDCIYGSQSQEYLFSGSL